MWMADGRKLMQWNITWPSGFYSVNTLNLQSATSIVSCAMPFWLWREWMVECQICRLKDNDNSCKLPGIKRKKEIFGEVMEHGSVKFLPFDECGWSAVMFRWVVRVKVTSAWMPKPWFPNNTLFCAKMINVICFTLQGFYCCGWAERTHKDSFWHMLINSPFRQGLEGYPYLSEFMQQVGYLKL